MSVAAMTGSEFDTAAVTTWIQSCEMDRTRDYLTRGRVHGGLTDVDLIDRWKAAFLALVAEPTSEAARVGESELKSEIDLRGMHAPFEEVEQALDELTNRLIDGIARLQRDDPAQLATCDRGVTQALADFFAQKQSTAN